MIDSIRVKTKQPGFDTTVSRLKDIPLGAEVKDLVSREGSTNWYIWSNGGY